LDFQLTAEQRELQRRCRELAADFASRSEEHDRDASHPVENYQRLREEGFLELSVPKQWGGSGVGFLGHTIAFEELGRGCPATALAFNMHASVVMPLLESHEVTSDAKRLLAELVVRQRKLIAGNFSEAGTTSLIGERPLTARARRARTGTASPAARCSPRCSKPPIIAGDGPPGRLAGAVARHHAAGAPVCRGANCPKG
jgi:alkylation response protein AidB-like acyl-CoA dehydrogenase